MAFKRFVLGFASGYVAGARAGRERYEQITRLGQRVMELPGVRDRAESVRGAVEQRARSVLQKGRGMSGMSGREDEAPDSDHDGVSPPPQGHRRAVRGPSEGAAPNGSTKSHRPAPSTRSPRNRPGYAERPAAQNRRTSSGEGPGLKAAVSQLAHSARQRGKVD